MKCFFDPFRLLLPFFILAALLFDASLLNAQENITSPEEFFDFQMGTDYKLARWDDMVRYFRTIEKESDRLVVMDKGPSTEGHPFLILLISSPENLSQLERLQMINKKISDCRNLPEDTLDNYLQEGKVVVFQSMSLHASEVGATQMAPELTYDLLSRNDKETRRILDNVLFFMIPCFNPDGQVMICDWYQETAGTEYEGLSMPYLYHKYCGHDNNRDGDYLNLTESKYVAKAMYVDWPAQAYLDHHQMGSYGARFYVPPYCDPIRPYADPLIWREISWYGAHIACKLEEQQFKGVLNAAQYPGWGHFGWHWIAPFHNIAGMLTEAASVRLASPVYIHPEQLRANTRNFPEYQAQSTFPSPWEGGWWHLRTIVEQQKSSAWSLLDMAARNRETVLKNACLKGINQTEKGMHGEVKTLIIPAEQHDHLTSVKMINILLQSGIKIKQAESDFYVRNRRYARGSFIISLAQPKMGLIRNLLIETRSMAYDAWSTRENGVPIRPYDLATHSMFEFMGINVEPADIGIEGEFSLLKEQIAAKGSVTRGTYGYLIDGRQNSSYKAVNRLLDRGIGISRTDKDMGPVRQGDFIIAKAPADLLAAVANETGTNFLALDQNPVDRSHPVKRRRIALFQRYYGGNMDEGWTRLCFEDFSFPYRTIMGSEIREGNLNENYDVIVLPNDAPEYITGIFPEHSHIDPEDYPEQYRSGMGEEGIKMLVEFVDQGGTLIAMGASYEFVVDVFDLDIRDVTKGLPSTIFFCPGSTLKVKFDNNSSLAYGMPDEGYVLNYSSPVFEVLPGRNNADYETVVRYDDRHILKSGWLIGEKVIAGKSGMTSISSGRGRIILIGFRTQHRNQTDGTFKLLFNALIR